MFCSIGEHWKNHIAEVIIDSFAEVRFYYFLEFIFFWRGLFDSHSWSYGKTKTLSQLDPLVFLLWKETLAQAEPRIVTKWSSLARIFKGFYNRMLNNKFKKQLCHWSQSLLWTLFNYMLNLVEAQEILKCFKWKIAQNKQFSYCIPMF